LPERLVPLQNGGFAKAASFNGFSSCQLSLHKETNIIYENGKKH
jgi:hypothetical protein